MTLKYEIRWVQDGQVVGLPVREDSLAYLQGYLARHREMAGPRLGARLIRNKDGKIVDEVEELTEVSLGMVAGFPSAAQYWQAGIRALERSFVVAKQEARRDAKH